MASHVFQTPHHQLRTNHSYACPLTLAAPSPAPLPLLQAVFFTFLGLPTYQGFFWMGVMVVVLSVSVFIMHFPQW